MNLWLVVPWVWVVLGLITGGLLLWQRAMVTAAERKAEMPAPQAFAWAVQFFLPAVWISTAVVAWIAGEGLSTSTASAAAGQRFFAEALRMLVIPQMLITAFLFVCQQIQADRLLPRQKTRREKAVVVLTVLRVAVLCGAVSAVILSMAVPRGSVLARPYFFPAIVLVVLFAIVQNRLSVQTAKGRLEMEESPLRDEILRIAAQVGWFPRTILLQAVGAKAGSDLTKAEVTALIGKWWKSFEPNRPRLPMLLLQRVDPDALTAVLAVRFARVWSPIPRSWTWANRLALGRFGRMALLFVLVLPAAIFFVGIGAALGPLAGYIGVMLFSAGVPGYVTWCRNREAFPVAFQAWRDADPSAERTPESFVAALARYDWVAAGIEKSDYLLYLYRQNKDLMRFLQQHGEQKGELALACAAKALEEAAGVGMDQVDAVD